MASGGGEDGDFGMQIAPMLDVLFVLLLYFMACAGVQIKEMELGISLPTRGGQKFETVETPIDLKIEFNGQIYYNNLPVSNPKDKELGELKTRLYDIIQKFGEKQPVIITPAPQVKHERIVDVLNACTAAGVKSLSFGS